MHHAGGATTLRVNQEHNGGEWVPLGSFDMAPGQNHRVVLSDDADEYVIGDAVRFVLETNARAVVADAVKIVGESPPPVDFADTGATVLREYVTLDGQPLALVEGSEIRYVHPDHLGTPQKMTDATGALVWDAVYKPFGEAHSITGSASNPQRIPGQLYDPETGFHYNYFRDYAPGLGRYVESDPIGLDGGFNTYAYVSGNPVGLVDRFGLAQSGDCDCIVSCVSFPGLIVVWCHRTLICKDDCGKETTQVWNDWYTWGNRGFFFVRYYRCDAFPGPLPNKRGRAPSVPGIDPPDPQVPQPDPIT